MGDDVTTVGDIRFWSDDLDGWLYRIYTESTEMQSTLEGMGLNVVAIYSEKGRVFARDYRANKMIVEELVASSKDKPVLTAKNPSIQGSDRV